MKKKKNPYFIISGTLLVYGLLICISNVGIVTTLPILSFAMILPTSQSYLGLIMLYLFVVGVLAGGLFALGLTKQKKHRSIEDDL